MNTKYSNIEIKEAADQLREWVKPGDRVYTVLKHVSASGMYRVIDLYLIKDNRPMRISGYAAKLLEGYDRKHEGCRAGGCGMDMGYHLVMNLGYALYSDGYTCPGKDCPSNDHNNPPHPEPDGKMHHNSGGYAFRQEWM